MVAIRVKKAATPATANGERQAEAEPGKEQDLEGTLSLSNRENTQPANEPYKDLGTFDLILNNNSKLIQPGDEANYTDPFSTNF